MIETIQKAPYLTGPNRFFMASKRAEYIRTILDNPHFTKTAFGLDLWPTQTGSAAASRLSQKMSEQYANRNLTEQEEERLVSELHKLADLINELLPRTVQQPQDEAVQPEKKLSRVFGKKGESQD